MAELIPWLFGLKEFDQEFFKFKDGLEILSYSPIILFEPSIIAIYSRHG